MQETLFPPASALVLVWRTGRMWWADAAYFLSICQQPTQVSAVSAAVLQCFLLQVCSRRLQRVLRVCPPVPPCPSQIRLVILSACSSQTCGDMFVRAGVPHVIAATNQVLLPREGCLLVPIVRALRTFLLPSNSHAGRLFHGL